jgi:hypothetical protein
VEFVTETCYCCGVVFALENGYYYAKQADKTSFWCPNGHSQHYLGKSDAQKLREQLAETERSLKWAQSTAERQRMERRAAEMQARAYKGHVTRLRNRIANGVCPVQGCQRSFSNVLKHIASQHPQWAHEHPEALADTQGETK